MFVTVITVVRNNRAGLARTIASVRSQSYQQIEFLVIDGASSDGTAGVIRDNEDIIDYWESRPDEGIYDAMNKGLRRATGQLVLFLNAGDELLASHSLQTAVNIAAEHAKSDVLYFKAIGDDGRRAGGFERQSALLFDSVGNHQAVLSRTATHHRFPFDSQYRVKADRDVQLRMMLAGYRLTSVPVVISRIEAGGVSSTAIVTKEWENLLICHRNRVGLYWMLLAIGLAASRLSLFGIARCCGLDWKTTKAIWQSALAVATRRRQPFSASNATDLSQ